MDKALTFSGYDRKTQVGVAIGGKDLDVLDAFCTNQIWARKIRLHALGAWSPWTKVTPNALVIPTENRITLQNRRHNSKTCF